MHPTSKQMAADVHTCRIRACGCVCVCVPNALRARLHSTRQKHFVASFASSTVNGIVDNTIVTSVIS